MRNLRTLLLALMLAALVPLASGAYTAGGTFVVKTDLGTIVDNGGVVCEGTNGDGIGGGCLPFPKAGGGRDGTAGGPGFVAVVDNAAGPNVAFQVCIDNNGDGICGGPFAESDACFDQIFFSHNDEGRFFNPLGPLPTAFLRGCELNGGFPGYVVLLCQGAHEVGADAHTHSLTQGHIGLATFGEGYGDFCGGGGGGGTTGDLGRNPAVAKGYVVN